MKTVFSCISPSILSSSHLVCLSCVYFYLVIKVILYGETADVSMAEYEKCCAFGWLLREVKERNNSLIH